MQKILADNRSLGAFLMFALAASLIFYVLTGNLLVLTAPAISAYLLLTVTNWKLAYWLFLFSIPLSIQYSLGLSLSLSLPDEPICWLFLCLFAMVFAYKPDIVPRWWWKHPLMLVVALQFLWLIVAVMFSGVYLLSLKFLLAKTWYLVCFFIFPVLVIKEKKDFKTLFVILLVPILATAVIIFSRQLNGHLNFADIGRAVGNVYLNHVEYGAVVSIFFPVVVVAYFLNRKVRKLIRYSLLAIVLFLLSAIFFTYARAAILAVVFAGIVGLAVRYRFVNFVMPGIYAFIVFVFIYLLHDYRYVDLKPDYSHTYMHADYTTHLTATLAGRDLSSMERLYRWVAAIRMSNDRPIVGYGPHGFVYNYKSYTLAAFRTYVSNNKEHSTTHNYFLYMLTEQGWPAMLLYALLIVVFFARAQSIYHRAGADSFYKACTLGLAMAFAAAFVNNFFSELVETHKVGAFFYLIIALLIIVDHKTKEVSVG